MKKNIILLFIIFSVSIVNAQIINLGEDYEKIHGLFDAGDFENTVIGLEKLIPEVEKVYTDTSLFYEMNTMMGLSLLELKKYTQAEQYFRKSVLYYDNSTQKFTDQNNYLAQTSLGNIYFSLNNFLKAEKYYSRALTIEKANNGEKSEDYLLLLQNLANSYQNQFKLNAVDSIYQKLLQGKKEVNGETSIEYAIALKALADIQKGNGKTKSAEDNYLLAKGILKNSQANKSKDYLSIINSLATIYKHQQKNDLTEAYYIEMADIYKDDNGSKSIEYASCINNLAFLYKTQNKFDKAEALFEKTLKAFKNSVGEKDILYITTLGFLADLYRNTGQYNKSEATYLEAKKLLYDTKGEKNLDYADILNNLALLYIETGRYDQAEINFKSALTITKDLLNDRHPLYATTLNNLADLYKEMGHFELAEPMYIQATAIRKEILGENHPEYGASLNNLAGFYESVKRIKEAIPLSLKSLEIAKNAYGEQHHEYALCLNNLANLYEENDDYAKAEEMYVKSLSILKTIFGESHSEYASTLHNLAFLYQETKRYKDAEVAFKKDLEIMKNSLGASHPNYAKALSNLGNVYEHMGLYKEAETNYLEAAKIRKEKLGDHHPDYTMTISNLARVYAAIGKNDEALINWQITISNYKEEIKKYFPSMSEKEKKVFCEKFIENFEQFNSFSTTIYASNPAVLSEMYNTQLATKALLFNSSNKVRQRILSSNDPALITMFKKWQSDKEYLAQLYVLPKNELTIDLDSLEKKTNELEKSLSLKSELFKSSTDVQSYVWQDVQKALKPNEAAIEMICFKKYIPYLGGGSLRYQFEINGVKQEKDCVYYAALIITPETKNNPEVVLLKNGTDLDSRYIKYYSNAIRFNVADEFCYKNYWSKIASYLGQYKKVYFSPEGVYNKINLLSVFNPATKRYIIDEIQIQTVTNTKDLLTLARLPSNSKKVVLIGDPDFGNNGVSSSRSGQHLMRLPGSGVEVQKIDNVLKTNNWASSIYTGDQSTEELVKSIQEAKILHIATHGFFKENVASKDSKGGAGNILLNSGLFLSAGLKDTKEDGTLTAYEAMNLNLDNTELVVLSACETGLGDIQNGEGVYGIQRAFRVAGAKSLIISLWKVDDVATQKLMTYFYEGWLANGNKRESFTAAQNKLRNEYKDPKYWGAFIIIGE